uniref:solute carrier family 15 member 1-like n=1 Tax=Epinephelus lanceolatus TaxID=310571 RepID=UPI0014458FD4|nr:solute carrier family 15 member 1-like [Epinephelus lanceolatus]
MRKPKKKSATIFVFPISIFFIVVNVFCERFSYYGMQAVLVLYFKYFLRWDDDFATTIYHTFVALCYLTPILGAIVADSWLSKFKTIVYLSIVYVLGQVVLAVSAIHDVTDKNKDGTPNNMTFHISLSMVGLLLIALASGGIRPCMAAFGGDQFGDHQEKQRSTFFSIFYLSINAGTLLSTVITPILRAQECGIHTQQKCYPLAFGVPAALTVVALIVFIVGSGMYTKNAPQGNILVKFLQQGLLIIQPDQMQTVNPILILVLVPVMNSLIYPLISKCKLNFTPLRRMTVGMFLAALAFVCAALVQIQIDKTLPKFPSSTVGQAKFINMLDRSLDVKAGTNGFTLKPYTANDDYLTFDDPFLLNLGVNATYPTGLVDGNRSTVVIIQDGPLLQPLGFMDIKTKPEQGANDIRFFSGYDSLLNVTVGDQDFGEITTNSMSKYVGVPRGLAKFLIKSTTGQECVYSQELGFASSFTLIIPPAFTFGQNCEQNIHPVMDIKPNTIHMAWQIPQYFLITAGEVVFSVTGLEFSYSQAPSNMKSVVQAGWLFTVAVGNIIVLIVAEAATLPDQWAEYILFASLLLFGCSIFVFMAYFYTYIDPTQEEARFAQREQEECRDEQVQLV